MLSPLSTGIRLNAFCFCTSKSCGLYLSSPVGFWVQSVITPLCAYIDGKRLNVSKQRRLITSCFKASRSLRSRMLMQFNLYTHPCWFHQAANHPSSYLITMQREPKSVSQRRHFWKHEIVRGLPSSCLKDIIHLCLTLSLISWANFMVHFAV